MPLGVAFIALGLWITPRFLRWYGKVARSMLGPTKQAALEQQVARLAESRADVVDAGAGEIRRIERDLHDGAQARLVAMGMTLSAAEQVLDQNPAAARALLLEARDASAKALTELRDLVRGIHPPVLADRGTGLRGIERRLSAFDGILAVSSPPGGPTVVTMELPCELSSPKTSSF